VIICENEAVCEPAEGRRWKSTDAIDVEAFTWANVWTRRKRWMRQILWGLFHSSCDAEGARSTEFYPLGKSVELGTVRITELHSPGKFLEAISACVAVGFVEHIPSVEISTKGLRNGRFFLYGGKTLCCCGRCGR
jgi:hypothetical protein